MTPREMFEAAKRRPKNFFSLSSREQWRIDEELGILDWDGLPCKSVTREEEEAYYEYYGVKGLKAGPYVCERCKDTHVIHTEENGTMMCTSCPRPCEECRSRGPGRAGGPYCAETPCSCSCHVACYVYKAFHKKRTKAESPTPVRRPTVDEVADYIERRMKAAKADKNAEAAAAYGLILDFARNGAFDIMEDPHTAMAIKAMGAMTLPVDPQDLLLLAGLFRAHAEYEAKRVSPWPVWGTCAYCPTDPNGAKRPWECDNRYRNDHQLELPKRPK